MHPLAAAANRDRLQSCQPATKRDSRGSTGDESDGPTNHHGHLDAEQQRDNRAGAGGGGPGL
jgi:hypothetical protein